MTEFTPFERRPDAELGAALRAALDGPDPDAFLARLRGIPDAMPERDSFWDVLGRWAPAGMAAAAAAALLLWFVVRPGPEPLAPVASAPVQMEVAPQQSEAVTLTVAIVEGR